MRHKKTTLWLLFFMAAWFLPMIISGFVAPNLKINFALLVWQQSLFIIGGSLGSRKELFQPIKPRSLLQGFLFGLGLFFLNGVCGIISQQLAAYLLGQGTVEKILLQERAGVALFLQSENPLMVTGVILMLVFGAPLGEELFFRAFLLDNLRGQMGSAKAVFLSALLFALLHFYFIQFLPVLVAGIFLGLLLVKTENIMIPIIAHGVSNFLALLIYLASL